MKALAHKLLAVVALIGVAASAANANEDAIRKNFALALPGLEIKSVEVSEIDGLFRVESVNSEILFTNNDGTLFLAGEMFSTKGGRIVNLSEQRKGVQRAEKMAAVKASEKIVYPAKGETKARITVFTDIDCGYCRKLHKEIPAMNEMGIEVSYVAYPRAGIGSRSYDKIVSAWCADNPLAAMDDAKSGKDIPSKTCANPVADQFALGQQVGVRGTPAIVLEDGTLVPGYLPAQQLGKNLGVL